MVTKSSIKAKQFINAVVTISVIIVIVVIMDDYFF